MKLKLIGATKMFIGLSAALGGFVLLYPLLQENIGKTNVLIGNIIGFTMLEVYGLYVLYSGWTEYRGVINLKKGIIRAGVAGSYIMFLVMLWVIVENPSDDMLIGGALTLGLLLFIGIRDWIRLKSKAVQHRINKE